jgi:hypothetical protein
MKLTLLDMTQDILSRMSSDEVNSISDSPEALQVANIIKNKYYDIVARGDLPEHNQIFQLNPSLTGVEPVLMTVPDGIGHIEWIKYFDSNVLDGDIVNDDNQDHDTDTDIIIGSSGDDTPVPPGYKYVTMLPIKQFLDMTAQFSPADADVESFTFSDTSNNFPGNFTFYYKNSATPTYCCILSNYYVIFDSYDNTQDSTLQASKTMCFGQVVPTFQMVDTFTPDLDSQQFPLLLNESVALAFYELKQQPHAKAEQEVKRQWSTVQKNKSINNRPTYFNELADFGRGRGNGLSGAGGWGTTISEKYTWQ